MFKTKKTTTKRQQQQQQGQQKDKTKKKDQKKKTKRWTDGFFSITQDTASRLHVQYRMQHNSALLHLL